MTQVILWALLLGGVLVLEGLGLTMRGHQWPTMSDMFRSATRPRVGRWLLFAVWLWAGWHFFIRGWQFFLRGSGAEDPGHGSAGGGKTVGQILTQVVVPLGLLYALAILVLSVGYLSWRARGGQRALPSRRTTAREFDLPRLMRHCIVSVTAAYVFFVSAMALFQFIARSGDDILWSAVVYGAFLGYVIALPAFLVLSYVEHLVLRGGDDGGSAPAG